MIYLCVCKNVSFQKVKVLLKTLETIGLIPQCIRLPSLFDTMFELALKSGSWYMKEETGT